MTSPEQDNTPEEPVKTAAEMQQEAARADIEAALDEVETERQNDGSIESVQLQKELDEALAKVAEGEDRALRLQAEMENQRRRLEKRIDDAHKYSVQKFAESLLPVVDSLEMGMKAEGGIEQIREGMDLTLKQFESVMDKFKLEAVGAEGDKFDPEVHQAISQQPSPEHEDGAVMAVMQKGYTLSGRTIRPAMVVVCKNG
uniref:Protein GrpE n=1 Tax=uncultured Thiotrichaceae bacterium TaxID=298394 RepID=A0A6S6SID4_9GAMM|nr:MAG: Heat shock protein GrpE [uncultured Thiotrichaceae bacterium]